LLKRLRLRLEKEKNNIGNTQAINKVTGVTKKQEEFAQAYVRCGNATEAYREAYSTAKMKPETIHVNACNLLNNTKVAIRINDLQQEAAKIAKEKFKVDSESILRHLTILSNARIDEYVKFVYEKVQTSKTDEDGEPIYTEVPRLIFKPFDELTEEQLMCIESIKQNRYGEVELKLHGKEWTIEKINKHIGFYEKDNKQKTAPLFEFDTSNLNEEEQKSLFEISMKLKPKENNKG